MSNTSTYAKNTSVSIDASLAEIRTTLARFGAQGFGFAEDHERGHQAHIVFRKNGVHVRFTLRMSAYEEFQWSGGEPYKGRRRTPLQQKAAWEQACRERFRALALAIKSKVVNVDTEIESFEEAFLAQIVTPGDERTVGETVIPQLLDERTRHLAGPLRLGPAPSQPVVRLIEEARG